VLRDNDFAFMREDEDEKLGEFELEALY
jgi:hypothetical protein